jgi:hypothetical protein
MSIDDDEIDITLRPPADVGARIIILATLLRRLSLKEIAPSDPDEAASEAFDLREWLRDQGLTQPLTSREAEILALPPEQIPPADMTELSWQGEALAALSWAAQLAPLPPYDAAADLHNLLPGIPAPWEATAPWIADLALVPESAIATERERAEIWHWRATVEASRRVAPPTEGQAYEDAIREVTDEISQTGLLSVAANDEVRHWRDVQRLADRNVDDLIAITAERMRALNWLCGFGDNWDTVPLDI